MMSGIHHLCVAELKDMAFLKSRQVAHLRRHIAEIEAELVERGGGGKETQATPNLGPTRKVRAA